MEVQRSNEISQFQIVCNVCDGLGIAFACKEDAPSSILIKCRHCGAPRGTWEISACFPVPENKISSKSEVPTFLRNQAQPWASDRADCSDRYTASSRGYPMPELRGEAIHGTYKL